MLLRLSILTVVYFMTGQAIALGPIDNFVANQCMDECMSEGPACDDCYRTAVDLFDQSDPVSPELNFELNDDHDKLELEF